LFVDLVSAELLASTLVVAIDAGICLQVAAEQRSEHAVAAGPQLSIPLAHQARGARVLHGREQREQLALVDWGEIGSPHVNGARREARMRRSGRPGRERRRSVRPGCHLEIAHRPANIGS